MFSPLRVTKERILDVGESTGEFLGLVLTSADHLGETLLQVIHYGLLVLQVALQQLHPLVPVQLDVAAPSGRVPPLVVR